MGGSIIKKIPFKCLRKHILMVQKLSYWLPDIFSIENKTNLKKYFNNNNHQLTDNNFKKQL